MDLNDLKNEHGSNCIGVVIRIIDKTRLIINIGEEDITVGDKIQIYSSSDIIEDLDGNILGVFEDIKATLQVTQTSVFYSVCSDIREEAVPIFPSFADPYTRTRTITKTLPVEDEAIAPLTKNADVRTIQVGDPVKKG